MPLTYGRMGNFLFQASAAAGYAWRHGMKFTLPSTTKNARNNPIYLQHLALKGLTPGLQTVRLVEDAFTYNALPFQEHWRDRNILLDGYWQSEKYFKEFRAEILQAFGFKWEHWQGFVSVHVRRTDYLKLTQKHPPVSKEWMEAMMAKFEGKHFIFFSDDIPWCKEAFGARRDCSFSEGKTEEQDLTQMSWCESHICSASTFSWWGAWLNQFHHKRVILPKEWFVKWHGGLDTSDIVPPEWERY